MTPIEKISAKANCERCGREFNKNLKKKDHRFCCASCRTAAWSFRTGGSKALSIAQKDIEKIKERLDVLEKSQK